MTDQKYTKVQTTQMFLERNLTPNIVANGAEDGLIRKTGRVSARIKIMVQSEKERGRTNPNRYRK